MVTRVVAIVQARMGSSRLPGKVLSDVGGRPMLQRVVERLEGAQRLDAVVVATTREEADRPLVEFCYNQGWPVFAGSEHDVLDRYLQTAYRYGADVVVRVTADCPLIDPSVVDAVVDRLLGDATLDYVCNFFPERTFPRGLDVEALRRSTLAQVASVATDPRYREHVTLYVYEHSANFQLGSVAASENAGGWRWTVDFPEDLEFVRSVYRHFGTKPFTWTACLRECLRHPDWGAVNQHLQQKAA